MVSQHFWTERRLTGTLLLLGTLLFFVSLVLIVGMSDDRGTSIVSLPDQARLPVIAANPGRWQWGWILGIAAIIVTVLGLVMLESMLREVGDRLLSRLGMIGFLFGAILAVIARAPELSVTVRAAETAKEAAMPLYLVYLGDWSHTLILIYTVLAFLSIVAYGGALLHTGLLPKWVGWTAIVWSIAWLVGLVLIVRDFDFPILHQIMPLLIGVLLLLRRYQVPADEHSAETAGSSLKHSFHAAGVWRWRKRAGES